jgi:hypothetical protein
MLNSHILNIIKNVMDVVEVSVKVVLVGLGIGEGGVDRVVRKGSGDGLAISVASRSTLSCSHSQMSTSNYVNVYWLSTYIGCTPITNNNDQKH